MPGVMIFAAGNVTNDLTYRESARDQRHDFLSFTMAANNGYIDENGEWKQTGTVWLNVKAFGALARNARSAVAKGRPVMVHGELKHESYDGADGHRHSSLELKADAIGLNLRMCASGYIGAGERYREIIAPAAAGEPAPAEVRSDAGPLSAPDGTANADGEVTPAAGLEREPVAAGDLPAF